MKKIILNVLSLFNKLIRFWHRITGRKAEDIHAQRVQSGKAWEEFCEQLKAAGAALVFPGAPQDVQTQAEGVRYLSRLTRAGLEAFVEFGDPRYPVFRHIVHETIKMGADNPDNLYLNAQISGKYDYVIRGRRNSVDYLGFFTQNGSYGTTGGLAPCGKLEGVDLMVEEDGTFEIVLSKQQQGKNWLKIEEESSLLMVRQTFRDRNAEKGVELSIEAKDVEGLPGSIEPKRLDEGLAMASLFVAGAPMLFAKWARGFKKHANQLPLFDPAVSNAAGGDASIAYYHSYWRLEEGEALLVTVKPPPCDNWNFQLNNYWMESLDYRYHNICINQNSAEEDANGTVRVIVAHEDPGLPNWLSTAGHTEGTMCWRWYRPLGDPPEQIETKVIALKNLKKQIYA